MSRRKEMPPELMAKFFQGVKENPDENTDEWNVHLAAQIKFEALKRMELDECLIDGDLFIYKPEGFAAVNRCDVDFIYSFFENNKFIIYSDERAKYYDKDAKKKAKTSNIVLCCSIAAVVLYTIAAMLVQLHTGVEASSTLSALWYGFWTVEITALAGIKVTKVIKDYNPDSTNENEKDDDSNAVG